ncbi:hypothetical protein LTR78_008655 [Recurvomyces mirabilis]|uniref:Ribosomal protein bL31m N-terminal domain-containing protein n=1 Tax=Recurvomyces mirabilis TaxID=574656 RepID=A0AAE0TUE5_9PEZI|nr:hypothetical protein LTR78_008655 [Recurvomyces mirabilis]KAK5159260.1 hypothetical protein LTS14_002402 [Recurvomyces mirabilis]
MLLATSTRPLAKSLNPHIPLHTQTRIQRQQTRPASLLRRPKRPYTFTQLITLSDGSTFTHRTTSPAPIYKSVRDTKNSVLWNPSSQKLLNVEEDEAGRLRRFRRRFGRGFDADGGIEEGGDGNGETAQGEQGQDQTQQDDSLLDLIAGYGQAAAEKAGAVAGGKEEKKSASSGKRKGGKK